MTVCLDSWAVMEWLKGRQPAMTLVEGAVDHRPVMSWVNLVEVLYRTERNEGRSKADDTLDWLRPQLDLELPDADRMVEAARLKARYPMALADCFAVATAAAAGVELWTGDPEIIDAVGLPCDVVDLRP